MADEDEEQLAAPSPEGEENENGEEEGGSGGFNAKKIILFVVVPLFILAGAGGGLYFSGALDKMLTKDETHEEDSAHDDGHGEAKSDEHGDGHSAPAGAAFLKIPDITVNLSNEGNQPRYLRLSVQLELKNQGDLAAVEQVMPRVVDQFQTYLRELRVKDLRGSAGIYRLQMELLSRVNAAAYPVEVQDVLFQEILIQ